MKIERITLTGFGAYKERTEVDFSQYSDAGVFLITGRTGAGKTTLLDAVTYALYGSIPSADSKGGDKARSHFCGPSDPTWVEVEFIDGGLRYRVNRSPTYMRAKTHKPEETTKQQERASLSVWQDGAWEVRVESQVRKVAEALDDIVKLSAEQFRQVILLAQGQFQEFLVASSEDRQKLLRTLFDSRRFEEYHSVLKEQRDELRASLTQTRTAVKTIAAGLTSRHEAPEDLDTESAIAVLDWLAPALVAVAGDVEKAESVEREAIVASDAADHALRIARDLDTRQKRRKVALDKVAVLLTESDEIEQTRTRLAAGRRADVAWESVLAQRTANQKVESSLTNVRQAETQYAAHKDSDASEALDDVVEELQRTIGALSAAPQQEDSLPSLAQKVAAAGRAVEQHAEAELDRTAQVTEMRAKLAAHQVRIRGLEPEVRKITDATVALNKASQRHRAAEEATGLAEELTKTKADQVEAGQRAAEALTCLTDLRRRQNLGFAGVLASELADGTPCGVCGSPTHPAPADSHRVAPFDPAKQPMWCVDTVPERAAPSLRIPLQSFANLPQTRRPQAIVGV